MLREGREIATLELGEHAGRAAYLVAFHASQALIFERTGKSAKSHRGVAGQFVQLAGELDKELRSFLAKSYNLKAVARNVAIRKARFERPCGLRRTPSTAADAQLSPMRPVFLHPNTRLGGRDT